ncbi:XRE family transcriptional regulator [Metabacillus fastidiosus]|uniref:XRE family transcriptional regulator n=1 Tax=Metabacillus fastidiosus TaxID=1458 RepID=UPI003D28B364
MECRIECLVKISGLEKAFITEKLGVSVKQFRNDETGHILVPIDKAFILSRFLGVIIKDLYEYVEQKE